MPRWTPPLDRRVGRAGRHDIEIFRPRGAHHRRHIVPVLARRPTVWPGGSFGTGPNIQRAEIRRLQGGGADPSGSKERHRVAMVGDGINDVPALIQADIGIAIGASTYTAIKSADIALMGDRLGGVMDAYEIGKSSYAKTKQNLVAAFSFNGIGVVAATTGLVHPVFAMIAMVLSVSVVLANSFAGQLLRGETVNTEFAVESDDSSNEKAASA